MSTSDPKIKREPLDDDVPMQDFDEIPLFVEVDVAPNRMRDAGGEAYHTVCFTSPFADHPHHHRLRCEHTIQTRNVQVCGSNCEIAQGANKKCSETAFTCPHPDCEAKRKAAKVFIQKSKQKFVRTRSCELSHVYGYDDAADTQHRQEKEEQMVKKMANTGVEAKVRRYRTPAAAAIARQRSRSPTREEEKVRERRSQRVAAKDADMLNALASNDAGFKAAMSLKGLGMHTKIKTMADFDKDIKDEKVLAALKHLEVYGTNEMFHQLEQARKQEEALEFRQPDRPYCEDPKGPKERDLQGTCDGCKEQLYHDRYRCRNCPDFDFCHTCYEEKRESHADGTHEFMPTNAIVDPATLEAPGDDAEQDENEAVDMVAEVEVIEDAQVHCICRTTATTLLVQCDSCNTHFHPGCHGLGQYQDEAYYQGHCSREKAMIEDHELWKDGHAFQCQACDGTTRSKHETAINSRLQEARKREKMNSYYKPSLTVQKRAALKKATTEDERKAIEAEYDARAQRMDDIDELFEKKGKGDGDSTVDLNKAAKLKAGFKKA